MAKKDRHKSFYFLVAVIGIILAILEVEIYRKTIISIRIPFVVTLVAAVIAFFVIRRDYKQTYQSKNFWFPFIHSIISFGFIACYIFMAANYYFADNNSETKVSTILTKHTIGTGSRRQPAIEIKYNEIQKQLVFFTAQQEQLDSSKHVILTVRKGLLGFDIFTDVTLK